ncbi:MAG TPA: protein-arginine deiminase family protein [Gemmataceae bacterium]|nr:protein-arginine deiminase family protein [Gemmataceae bacterium]
MRSHHRRTLAAVLLALLPALALAVRGGAEPAGLRFDAARKGPHGTVLLLNNCDASDMPADGKDHADRYGPDNADAVINGPADLQQVEPIKLRQARPRGAVTLRLVNDPAGGAMRAVDKVRVFNARGKEILGNHTGTAYALTRDETERLARGDLPLYAEGLQFAVAARLQLLDGGEKQDELALYVAPFLMSPHTQLPVRNMVVHLTNRRCGQGPLDSDRYVADFADGCRRAGVDAQVFSVPQCDVWIQDELEWGWTETPRASMPVVLHMHRQRELDRLVRGLLAPGVGYFHAFDYRRAAPESMDYGGDLEVTPPTREYPFGRVYYGSVSSTPTETDRYVPHRHIADGFQEFFRRQKRHPSDAHALQEPIGLCTDWLGVGHVDEIVSFVPANTKHGFALLWASPERALELLQDLPPETRQDPRYLDPRYGRHYGLQTVEDILQARSVGGSTFLGPGQDLQTYNLRAAAKVRRARDTLQKELGLGDDEVFEVPVLFANEQPHVWAALALTPGMVNLSSMGRVSLVPDPLIPAFREDCARTLRALGQTPVFIDDWALYHTMAGEVHCGSNQLRKPFDRKWWD